MIRKRPSDVVMKLSLLWRWAAEAAEEFEASAFLAPAGSCRAKDLEGLAMWSRFYAEALSIVLNPYPRQAS